MSALQEMVNLSYIRIALTVADDRRVLFDVEEIDRNVAPQKNVVDRRLNFQREKVRRVVLESKIVVKTFYS